jgi:hypothetical protein
MRDITQSEHNVEFVKIGLLSKLKLKPNDVIIWNAQCRRFNSGVVESVAISRSTLKYQVNIIPTDKTLGRERYTEGDYVIKVPVEFLEGKIEKDEFREMLENTVPKKRPSVSINVMLGFKKIIDNYEPLSVQVED